MAKRKKVMKKVTKRAAPRAKAARPTPAKPARKKAAAPAAKTAAPLTKASVPPPAAGSERRRHDPQTLRLRSYQPGITVNDLKASIRFYTDVLGFIVGEEWKNDNNVLMGVSLKAGACSLGLSQDDWAKGKNRRKGEGVRLWCETVQDIDALAGRIKSEGWTLTAEPKFQQWGMRLLELDDPDGYHLTVFKNT